MDPVIRMAAFLCMVASLLMIASLGLPCASLFPTCWWGVRNMLAAYNIRGIAVARVELSEVSSIYSIPLVVLAILLNLSSQS